LLKLYFSRTMMVLCACGYPRSTRVGAFAHFLKNRRKFGGIRFVYHSTELNGRPPGVSLRQLEPPHNMPSMAQSGLSVAIGNADKQGAVIDDQYVTYLPPCPSKSACFEAPSKALRCQSRVFRVRWCCHLYPYDLTCKRTESQWFGLSVFVNGL
jgi:hypothetical protein